MQFKEWLIEENALEIPLNKLWGWNQKVREVVQNISLGKLSYSQGKPLIISRLDSPRGHFFVLDGHHRVVEAIMNGQNTIQANLDEYTPRIERTGGAHKSMVNEKIRIIDALSERQG